MPSRYYAACLHVYIMNTGQYPLRRAAGMIAFLWGRHKLRSKEVYSLPEAVAVAAAHEPQLSDEQLRYAARWAQASHQFRTLANARPADKTLEQLRYESGLGYYADQTNWPEDQ